MGDCVVAARSWPDSVSYRSSDSMKCAAAVYCILSLSAAADESEESLKGESARNLPSYKRAFNEVLIRLDYVQCSYGIHSRSVYGDYPHITHPYPQPRSPSTGESPPRPALVPAGGRADLRLVRRVRRPLIDAPFENSRTAWHRPGMPCKPQRLSVAHRK